MSYEFEPDASSDLIPKVPNFFDTTGRIRHLLPNDPVFVSQLSVIRDPNSEDIGIDTTDRVPSPAGLDHMKMLPVGVLRVCHIEPATEGFIVDLRHSKYITERVLGFSGGDVSDEIAEQNKRLETVPVAGAIFQGLGTGLLHFVCKKADEAVLQPYAGILAEWVDTERQKQGIQVPSAELQDTPTEIRAKEYLRKS